MKKLGKITINPEKVIKNEELINLKGGEYGSGTGCYYYYSDTMGTDLICCCEVDGGCGSAPSSYAVRTYNNCNACDQSSRC